MSIAKLQGLRPKISTVDEWLSGDTREDVVGALEQGASKLDDYIIVATSSEGTVRNGAGDTIKMELLDILKGEYVNPHVSIWWYKLDSIDEVGNPDMWLKANPNIGKTVSYETYQLDVERAENLPPRETIFWQKDLVYRWKVIPIILHMKKHFFIKREVIGRCRVLWALIYHKVMTSVLLHFYFHYQMVLLESKPETTFLHQL